MQTYIHTYMHAYIHACMHTYIHARPVISYRAVITWVYVGFAKGGFDILWCAYLWVATSPCGGFGGPPPRKMKCSRSDSRSALGAILGQCLGAILGLFYVYIGLVVK